MEKSDEVKIQPKKAVESFLTGKVLQQFLLMVKTLGKERERAQHMFTVIYLSNSLISLSTIPFFLCVVLFH